jgi:hypothetical protein
MTWVTPDVRAPLSFVAVGIFRHEIFFRHEHFQAWHLRRDIYTATVSGRYALARLASAIERLAPSKVVADPSHHAAAFVISLNGV